MAQGGANVLLSSERKLGENDYEDFPGKILCMNTYNCCQYTVIRHQQKLKLKKVNKNKRKLWPEGWQSIEQLLSLLGIAK